VDYAQLGIMNGPTIAVPGRYSPGGCTGMKKIRREGNPDIAMCHFCRIQKTLRMSPAMAAGVRDRLWSLEDIVAKIKALPPAPKPRGPYKKRA
jgi:hypothetical protein